MGRTKKVDLDEDAFKRSKKILDTVEVDFNQYSKQSTADRLDERKAVIAELMIKGYPLAAIVQHLYNLGHRTPTGKKLSQDQVYSDQQSIREAWKKEQVSGYDELVNQMVNEYNLLKVRAYENNDLTSIAKALEGLRKMLGVDAPVRLPVDGDGNTAPIGEVRLVFANPNEK